MNKPAPTLSKGAKVRVYQKPLTREAFEDVAVLVSKNSDEPDGYQRWQVRFEGERTSVARTVHARDLLTTRYIPGVLKRRGRHAPQP